MIEHAPNDPFFVSLWQAVAKLTRGEGVTHIANEIAPLPAEPAADGPPPGEPLPKGVSWSRKGCAVYAYASYKGKKYTTPQAPPTAANIARLAAQAAEARQVRKAGGDCAAVLAALGRRTAEDARVAGG